MRPERPAIAGLALAILLASISDGAPARAFTIESPVFGACHEHITLAALARAPFAPDVPTVPADDAQRRLASALPFTVPAAAASDPRVVALLIGVREADVGALAATDLDRLATVHGDPATQPSDCLRSPADDGVAGDARALAACRAYIEDQVARALGPADEIDAGTEDVGVSLAFEGTRTVPLARFPHRVGLALHALQDSFSHTYRDASGTQVLTVHNWVDWVTGHYDPARDGVRHQSDRDHCTGDAASIARATHAEDASAELLAAIADPSGGRAGRLARTSLVLDRWLTLTPGCDASNAWCGSPDAVTSEGGCSIAARRSSSRAPLAALALALVVLARRRARPRPRPRPRPLALALALALAPAPALAQDAPPPAPRPLSPFAASLTIGGAIESPSAVVSLGGRWFPSDEWRVGLDVEWSPWFSLAAVRGAPGVFDAFASLEWDWARVPGLVRIGTRIAAGISVLLFDEYGASAGDVGPLVAATLVGAGFELDREWELRVDPEASVAMPHVVGTPQVFREYRLSLSLVFRPESQRP